MRRFQLAARRYPPVWWVILSLLLAACGAPKATPPAPAQPQPAAQPAAPAPAQPAPAQPAPPAPPAKPVPIRLGHGFAAEEQVWLMKARPDLTPNQGKWYTLEYTPFRANADRLKAYQAGELDAGTIAANTAVFAVAQGLDFRFVASISREAQKGFKSTFLVMDDSGIKTVADLRGKTVGIVDYKSSTDMWAWGALKKAGLDPAKDVKLVVIPFPAMGDSLRTKKIDAGVFVQPFYSVEMAKGGLRALFNSKDGVPFDEELMLLFFNPEFVAKNRNVVQAFLDDYKAANEYYVKNPKDAKKSLVDSKMVTQPVEAYQAQEDWYRSPDPRVDVASMEQMLDMAVQIGWLTQKYDFKKYVDNSFFK